MSRTYILAGAFLVCAVVAGVFVASVRRQESRPISFQESMRVWEERFQTLGAERAYQTYLEEGRTLSYDEAHDLAHAMGEVLYRVYGEEGLSHCTADFAFGCFHGFAGFVLETKGLSVVEMLARACDVPGRGVYLGCMHGVGHGILSYLGSDDLREALLACPAYRSGEGDVGGCPGGIFMEYNFNTMQSPTGVAIRPPGGASLTEPCENGVPKRLQPACFYEMPSWWRALEDVQGVPEIEQYRAVGARCAEVSDEHLRSVCFRGMGNVIGPQSDYDVSVMRTLCGTLPGKSAFALCYGEALGHLLGQPDGPARLRAVCEEEPDAPGALCR